MWGLDNSSYYMSCSVRGEAEGLRIQSGCAIRGQTLTYQRMGARPPASMRCLGALDSQRICPRKAGENVRTSYIAAYAPIEWCKRLDCGLVSTATPAELVDRWLLVVGCQLVSFSACPLAGLGCRTPGPDLVLSFSTCLLAKALKTQ